MAARRRLPAGFRPKPSVPLSAAAVRGVQAAMVALADESPGPVGDEALAIRERLRLEAEAQRRRQGLLRLGD